MFVGGPNFFENPESSVLLNSGLWAKAAGLHPAQILRSQHVIALKILLVHVRLLFSTKNRFLCFGPFPGHAPAWEIIISATCCRLKCAPCLRKTTILTNLIFIEMQKTPLTLVRTMFCVATVVFLLEQLL